MDVDATTRRLLSPGNLIYRSLVRSFGARAVLQKGSRQIDRSRLTEYLRANEEKRARFNRIMTRSAGILQRKAPDCMPGHRL